MTAFSYADLLGRWGSAGYERRDGMRLLAAASGLRESRLMARLQETAPRECAERFFSFLRRRRAGEPVQYILGEWEFMGHPMRVTPDVLIPRADTECLAERAIECAREAAKNRPLDDSAPANSPRVLDLCTGSGCVAISVAHYVPEARVTATDVSPAALAVARENAERNGVAARIAFACGDLFDALANPAVGSDPVQCPVGSASAAPALFDVICANPPYVSDAEMDALPPDVRLFEPALALRGGPDGLAFYRAIAATARPWLRPGGALLLECGATQAAAVADILRACNWRVADIARDLAGVPRVVHADINLSV